MDLIVLGVGIVLGTLSCAAFAMVRSIDTKVKLALGVSAGAQERAVKTQAMMDEVSEKLNTHDHEIAALFDHAGFRRG